MHACIWAYGHACIWICMYVCNVCMQAEEEARRAAKLREEAEAEAAKAVELRKKAQQERDAAKRKARSPIHTHTHPPG